MLGKPTIAGTVTVIVSTDSGARVAVGASVASNTDTGVSIGDDVGVTSPVVGVLIAAGMGVSVGAGEAVCVGLGMRVRVGAGVSVGTGVLGAGVSVDTGVFGTGVLGAGVFVDTGVFGTGVKVSVMPSGAIDPSYAARGMVPNTNEPTVRPIKR